MLVSGPLMPHPSTGLNAAYTTPRAHAPKTTIPPGHIPSAHAAEHARSLLNPTAGLGPS